MIPVRQTSSILLGTVTALVAGAAAVSATGLTRPGTLSFTAVNTSALKLTTKIVIRDDDYAGKRLIGHDNLTCAYATGKCTALFALTAGTIKARFVGSGTTGSGTVVGGTGSYSGARGSFTWRNLNASGSRTGIVITFS